MTIKILKGKRQGQILENAYWFGFNYWCRVWVTEPDGVGWLHFSSSEFQVIKP